MLAMNHVIWVYIELNSILENKTISVGRAIKVPFFKLYGILTAFIQLSLFTVTWFDITMFSCLTIDLLDHFLLISFFFAQQIDPLQVTPPPRYTVAATLCYMQS